VRVPCAEGYRIWSATYDGDANPVLALDSRALREQLGSLRGLRMIDVACGTGRWMMEAHAQGADVAGIDSSWEMLAVAASKPALTGRLILGQAGQLPFGAGAADLVLCSMAINYFPSLEGAFAEMARVVRLGGRVVVSDIHPDAIAAGWNRSFRSGGSSYEIDHQTFGIRQMNDAAKQSSLKPAWHFGACFGPSERVIFQRMAKEALFAELSSYPALHIACWTKL
jgi:ubiquinone/menaquinone biosynthesis C-methylase UbiE